MEVKARLQRALQILEDVERVEMLSDIERDILLTELREAYAELKYSDERRETKDERQSNVEEESIVEESVEKSAEESVVELPVAPIAPITPTEEEQDEEQEETEPEVEVELIFNEEEDEETENGKRKTENEEVAEEQVAESAEEQVAESAEEPAAELPITPTEKSEEIEDNLSTLNSQLSTPKRSALLSLYEDAPTPVLGEQFHESPSVADTIACPKGVAESAPVASLREAIGLADKFMLIRELFDGNAEEYDKAIATLDKQPSFDDCIIYISENYTWSPNAQATKLVMELLQRKYN